MPRRSCSPVGASSRSRELIDTGRWGDWKALRPVQPPSSATLGLVGVGRIGGQVVRLLGPFFGGVISFDPVQDPPPGARAVTLDEISRRRTSSRCTAR